MLFLNLVLSSITSLRGAARAIETVTSVLPVPLPLLPCSWWTGRLWLLRVGLYKLTRPKTMADDWVWILDHSVQSGPEKCLLILGIRLSSLRAESCLLSYEDMEPIALCPVRSSTGDIVYQQLQAAAQTTGIPREIVSDHGPDLQAGIRQFCQQHPTTCAIYDITHKAARLLKDFLSYDERWDDFCRFAAVMKSQVQLTVLAPLAPPNQRSKARYMNVDELGRWASKMLQVLEEDPVVDDTTHLSTHTGVEKVTWLETFRDDIADWSMVFELVDVTERAVRRYGMSSLCVQELEQHIHAQEFLPHVSNFGEDLLTFVRTEAAKARPDERLLGSSEVIESVFGKLKHIEGAQAKQGFTGLILSAAALVAPTTPGVVRDAMKTVSTADVQTWCRDTLGPSVQAQRTAIFSNTLSGTKMGSI